MAKDKKSVLLYCDLINTVEKLDDKTAGELFKHYLRYINDLNPITENILVDVVFEPIKQTLKRDLKKWDEKIIGKSNAGKMSAAKNKFDKYKIKILADLKETDFDFELMYFTESKKDYKSTDYMYMYFDLCINFLLQHKPTKSTPVESVEVCSTKSTVNVNDSVNVNGSVIVNDNVNKIKPVISTPISENEIKVPFYPTKKKRKLKGKRLESFETFWKLFDYKNGKAAAADSWLDIPLLTEAICKEINEAAKKEAAARQSKIDKGASIIMAQGWLTGRRWEDEVIIQATQKQSKATTRINHDSDKF